MARGAGELGRLAEVVGFDRGWRGAWSATFAGSSMTGKAVRSSIIHPPFLKSRPRIDVRPTNTLPLEACLRVARTSLAQGELNGGPSGPISAESKASAELDINQIIISRLPNDSEWGCVTVSMGEAEAG